MRLNKILFSLAISALFLSSCDKEVDLRPTDVIPIDRVFQTVNDLNLATIGVYGTWQARRSVYLSALISDETRQGSGAEYRNVGGALFRWEYTTDSQDFRDDEPAGAWTNLYAVIDRANRALYFLDGVPAQNATETALKTQIKGELLALRGFAHFELMRWYAQTYSPDALGIPYMLTYAMDPGNFKPARIRSSEVIANVNKDLADALPLIPTTQSDISRITKNAVSAMQARVALYTRNWDATIAAASTALSAQPIATRANYSAIWTTRTLSTAPGAEVIWKLNITVTNLGSAIGSLFQDANTAIQFSPSTKLMSTFDAANDVRYSLFFKTRTSDARPLIGKYGATITQNSDNFQYDIKMLRSSEILLSRAEAYAEKNDLVNGAADLNSLRAQRINGYTNVTYTNKEALIADILQERYKELCYEGNRYFDLKRRSLPIVRLPEDVQGSANIQRLEPNNFRYLLPIPQQEIFANPVIAGQQNPGY